jgi:hypothetical protein
MLAGRGRTIVSGARWINYDIPVYICTTLDKAKEILGESHIRTLEPSPVWTTIYRVVATDIDCDKYDSGRVWTRQSSKIFVDKPVFYKEPRSLSETALLRNAQRILPHVSKLMNNTYGVKEKTK